MVIVAQTERTPVITAAQAEALGYAPSVGLLEVEDRLVSDLFTEGSDDQILKGGDIRIGDYVLAFNGEIYRHGNLKQPVGNYTTHVLDWDDDDKPLFRGRDKEDDFKVLVDKCAPAPVPITQDASRLRDYLERAEENLADLRASETRTNRRMFAEALVEGAAAVVALVAEQASCALADAVEMIEENDGLKINLSCAICVVQKGQAQYCVKPKISWSTKHSASLEFVSGGLTCDLFYDSPTEEETDTKVVQFESRFNVNEHGVVTNPEGLDIILPKSHKAKVTINLAETVDGLWCSSSSYEIDDAAGSGPIMYTHKPVSLIDAIEARANEIATVFERHNAKTARAFRDNGYLQTYLCNEVLKTPNSIGFVYEDEDLKGARFGIYHRLGKMATIEHWPNTDHYKTFGDALNALRELAEEHSWQVVGIDDVSWDLLP